MSVSALRSVPARAFVGPALIIVIAGTILSISMGLRQCMGLFLPPVRIELGLSASAFGLAMAIQNIVWGFGQPIVGMLGDRYGARLVLIGSALLYAGGLLIMALSQSAFGVDFGGGIVAGLGVAGTAFGVLIGAVSRAVPPEKRSQAVGTVSAVGSLGTLILAPFGQAMIGMFGWRMALCAFAAVAASMAVIAMTLGGNRQAAPGAATREDTPAAASTVRQAIGHSGYLAMTAAFFACGFQLMFIIAYLPQYLAICGVSPATSASALGLIGLGNAVGSLVFGRLGGRFSQKRLLSLIYLLRTLTIVIFLSVPVTSASTLAFATAMGFLWLGVIPLVSGLIGALFGMRYFNTLFGLTFLGHQLGAFTGAWIGGLIFDLTGDFKGAWTAMIMIGLTAATLQWLMDDTPNPKRATMRRLPA